MKNILITGANSYVGTSFEKWLSQWPDKYHVDTIDMIDASWHEKSFVGYDSVLHVAGIVHRNETQQNAYLYYKVNRDLAIDVAEKAKHDNVKQFIFMSTMAVYGKTTGIINKSTKPSPVTEYAKSKYQAEQHMQQLAHGAGFNVVILRSPMIYGKNCHGNYQRLRTFILKYKIFPDIANKRSLIQINNLCAYIQKCVDLNTSGIFVPQDPDYVCTRDMVAQIAKFNGQNLFISPLLNFIYIIPIPTIKKMLGNLYYSDIDNFSHKGISFPDTVAISEKGYMDKT